MTQTGAFTRSIEEMLGFSLQVNGLIVEKYTETNINTAFLNNDTYFAYCIKASIILMTKE